MVGESLEGTITKPEIRNTLIAIISPDEAAGEDFADTLRSNEVGSDGRTYKRSFG